MKANNRPLILCKVTCYNFDFLFSLYFCKYVFLIKHNYFIFYNKNYRLLNLIEYNKKYVCIRKSCTKQNIYLFNKQYKLFLY